MPRLAGIRIEGRSSGGIETCIDLPELKLAFDLGRTPHAVIPRPTILFTHAHVDHMAGVVWHAGMRELRRLPAPTYVVPRENAADFEALFEVWRRLDRSDLAVHTVPLGPGDEHDLGHGLSARPFRSPHRVPCQGYALWRRKHKLKPELEGLGPEALREARTRGAIADPVEQPELAFTGDTRIEVVEREEVVRRARVLIMEVTFLDERVPVAEARAKGHVHLDEVVERADLFENEALLFTHFSARYRPAEVREILARRLPPALAERVTPLLPEPR